VILIDVIWLAFKKQNSQHVYPLRLLKHLFATLCKIFIANVSHGLKLPQRDLMGVSPRQFLPGFWDELDDMDCNCLSGIAGHHFTTTRSNTVDGSEIQLTSCVW